ncbi:MAG TPA: TolC family protein, partial [Gemmatimonadaceae bacterium]
MRRVATLVIALAVTTASACVHSAPKIDGVAPTPPSPASTWSPPAAVQRAAARDTAHLALSTTPMKQFTLAEAVDLALRNSPATRISYSEARSAADVYGSTSGRLFPTLTAGVTLNQTRALSQPGRPADDRSAYGPSLTLSY